MQIYSAIRCAAGLLRGSVLRTGVAALRIPIATSCASPHRTNDTALLCLPSFMFKGGNFPHSVNPLASLACGAATKARQKPSYVASLLLGLTVCFRRVRD
jgi:hypothetical protein